MPLYNNILLSRKGDAKSGEQNVPTDSASASMKLLQDHLLSKKRAKLQLQPSNQRSSKLSADNIKSRDASLHHKSSSENDWDPLDEYDPMMPNSYEVLKAEYLKAEERRLTERKSGIKIDPNILDVLDKLDGEDYSGIETTRGASIAPPPALNIYSGESSNATTNCKISSLSTSGGGIASEKLDGTSAAAKIMSKMGYKAGQGLGRDEQGISAPLEVEKSGFNAGRIIQPQLAGNKQPEQSANEQSPNDSQATQVLLLQNMVGPGEVDDDLEAETKEECKKYGDVIKCLIYEIPNKRVPDEEAVRIFVEFKRTESAIKAVSDLNGRYFGGRVVRASFYNVNKFSKYELGP